MPQRERGFRNHHHHHDNHHHENHHKQVTPDSLASMRERISEAAQLILPGVRSDILIIIILMMMMAIMIARRESSSKILSSPSSYKRLDMLGYGCTSASAVLGEGTVFSQLASRCHNH